MTLARSTARWLWRRQRGNFCILLRSHFWNRIQQFKMNYIFAMTNSVSCRVRHQSIGVCGWVCGSITPNQNFTDSMNVSLDFNVGIHEKHSTLAAKYEFSFTTACKYLNSGKWRKRPPAPSRVIINKRHTVFQPFLPLICRITMAQSVCVRFNWKTERIQSEAPKRIDFYLKKIPQKYIFGTNEPCQCHKERRWRWSQSKQRTQGLRTRECNGDGWHRRDAQRKESRQWSRAHDADTPKWARVWQTKSWNK